MKNKKIVIIIISIIVLGSSIGLGMYLLQKGKVSSGKPEEKIPIDDEKDISEMILKEEEAFKLLEEKYSNRNYIIKLEKELDDVFSYKVMNSENNIIEMMVTVNKFTKKVIENKIVSVGSEGFNGEISGGKIE